MCSIAQSSLVWAVSSDLIEKLPEFVYLTHIFETFCNNEKIYTCVFSNIHIKEYVNAYLCANIMYILIAWILVGVCTEC